jgi:NAD(P)-dependent dehydrogenase (short-subunit alcohol dehydrogenase family)
MNLEQLAQLYDFTGKSVVITGGTGVLGAEITSALLKCNANVAILSRNPAAAESLIKRIGSGKGRCVILPGDVMERKALEVGAKLTLEEFGRIDCLINAAGGNSPKATAVPPMTFFDLQEEGFKYVTDLNLLGTVLPCQVFGKQMAEKKEGVILNVSSMAAFRPLTRVAAYAAAKAAVTNFTQWLAVHMAQEYSPKIRVNAIAPGFFLTEQNRFLLTEKETGKLTARGQKILDHTPMARFGEPRDLIGAVLWLLSPASTFVTGIVLPIDGGFSAYSGV